jgi:hypothetical protein
MSVQTVAKQFGELCRQGRHFDVMRTIYAPDITPTSTGGRITRGEVGVYTVDENVQITRQPFFYDRVH